MKFFLTIWICSVVNQNCAEVPFEKHEYDRFYASHYECVQKGLGESYSILYDGELFSPQVVEALELYPKFGCEKTDNSKNEQSDTTLSESKDL
jgi:hypothetical protein